MKTIWIINHHALPPSLGGLNRHYYFKKELEKRGYNVKIFTGSQIHNQSNNLIDSNKPFLKMKYLKRKSFITKISYNMEHKAYGDI